MKPKVSMIIPLYNVEKFVGRCVQCIKNQTYQNIEVIFVNDGSTDNTAVVCEKCISGMDNFQMISTDNRGVSSARNTGVSKAVGEYVVFADADDFFFEDYIEYLVQLALKYDADIAMCDYRKQKADELKLKNPPKKIYEKVYSITEALENVSYRKELSGSPYAKLIKRTTAEQICYNEKVYYYEDYLYICDAIINSEKVVFGNNVKYLYLQHPQSSTHKYDCEKCVKSWEEFMICTDKYKQCYPELIGGFRSKELAVSLDMLKKMYKRGYEEAMIREYVKENSFLVARDTRNTTLKRLLALCAGINIDMAVVMGRSALRLLSAVGWEL